MRFFRPKKAVISKTITAKGKTIKGLLAGIGLGIGLGIGVLSLGAAASAETKGALTSDDIERVLETAGLSPAMTQDASTGAPVARGEAGAVTFWVRALGCGGNPQACDTLVFFANFNLGRGVAETDYRIVNHYNDSQVFGRAYIIEDKAQVGVDYVIELSGGVTEDHLSDNISRWGDVIIAFVESFAAGDTGS